MDYHYINPDVVTSSPEYAARFGGPVGEFLLDVQTSAIRKLFHAPSTSSEQPRVLDVGGGHCQLTPFFLELGYKVTIQGSSPQCFERAKKLGLDSNPNLSFLESPLERLPLPNQEFDIVTAVRLLAHMLDWQSFLREISRVCKHQLIFDFASLYTSNIATPFLFEMKKRIEKNTRPYFCQTRSAVFAAVREQGFSSIQSYPQFSLPMGFHRLASSPALSRGSELVLRQIGLTRCIGTPVMIAATR